MFAANSRRHADAALIQSPGLGPAPPPPCPSPMTRSTVPQDGEPAVRHALQDAAWAAAQHARGCGREGAAQLLDSCFQAWAVRPDAVPPCLQGIEPFAAPGALPLQQLNDIVKMALTQPAACSGRVFSYLAMASSAAIMRLQDGANRWAATPCWQRGWGPPAGCCGQGARGRVQGRSAAGSCGACVNLMHLACSSSP